MLGLKNKKEEEKAGLMSQFKERVLPANGSRRTDVTRIDEEIRKTISEYSAKPEQEIDERLEKLEREWDTEKMVRTNAAIISILGLTMGLVASRRWFILSGLALPFLFMKRQLKMMGVRSNKEIEAEKYALKALRGDFAH